MLRPACDEFAKFVYEWDRLNREQFQHHPLLDVRFVRPLLERFGGEHTLLATYADGDEVLGALLLEPRKEAVWSSFLPGQAQIAPVVVIPERSRDLLKSLTTSLPRCLMLEVMNQDWDFSCFRGDSRFALRRHWHATTMNVHLDGSFEAYWSERPRKLRENIRRYFNRVRKSGLELRLRALTAADEMPGAVDRYGALESRGWKGAQGTAVRHDNEQGRFYDAVMSNFARDGCAHVYELYLGEQLAASRLLVSSDDMLVALKTTYDESMSRYAPGRLLQYSFLELEFERATHKVVEFYTNSTKETLQWASSSRDIYHVSLYRPGLMGTALRRVQQAKARVAPAVNSVAARFGSTETAKMNAAVPGSRYTVDVVDTYETFMSLKVDWDKCCARDGYSSIFLTHEWFENFVHEVMSDAAEFAIFLVRRDQEICAIFPIMSDTMTILGSQAECRRFLTNFYSPVAKPIWGTDKREERQEVARVFIEYMVNETRPWDVLDFNLLPEETGDREILEKALADMDVPSTGYSDSANWIQPTADLSADEYARTILSSRVRNTIKRRMKRAEAQGSVECLLFTSIDDVTAHIDDYYAVYKRSWKRPEPYANFHRRLAEKMAARDKTILGVIYFKERPVAAQIWLVHENIASILKLCYDDAYKEFSFGTLLTFRLMSYVIDERNVELVDYLTGDDTYKKDWMSVRRERRGVLGFNPKSRRGALFAFVEGKVKPRLKQLATSVKATIDRTGKQ